MLAQLTPRTALTQGLSVLWPARARSSKKELTDTDGVSALEQLKQLLSEPATTAKLMRLLRGWDTKNWGDGHVSRKEWRRAIFVIGYIVSAEVLNEMFDTIDAAGVGEVSFEQLKAALRQIGEPEAVEAPRARRNSFADKQARLQAAAESLEFDGSWQTLEREYGTVGAPAATQEGREAMKEARLVRWLGSCSEEGPGTMTTTTATSASGSLSARVHPSSTRSGTIVKPGAALLPFHAANAFSPTMRRAASKAVAAASPAMERAGEAVTRAASAVSPAFMRASARALVAVSPAAASALRSISPPLAMRAGKFASAKAPASARFANDERLQSWTELAARELMKLDAA